jgi:hypothetical protein
MPTASTGEKVDDDGDDNDDGNDDDDGDGNGDGAMGSGATGYDDNDDGAMGNDDDDIKEDGATMTTMAMTMATARRVTGYNDDGGGRR